MSRHSRFDSWPKTRAELKFRYYTFTRMGTCRKCGRVIEYWLSTNRIPLIYDVMLEDVSPATLHSKTCTERGRTQ
jgi:hypothetical protein